MKVKIGQVTDKERDEIQNLFERKNGLSEIAKILNSEDSVLYEKLVKDMGETNVKFQNWWRSMSEKYHWQSVNNGHWEIDFESCDIFLVS